MNAKERIEEHLMELEGIELESNDIETVLDLEKLKGDAIKDLKEIEENDKASKKEVVVTVLKGALGILTAVVPLCISGVIYFKAQKNLLEFEETGRVNSKAGRELQLPRIF